MAMGVIITMQIVPSHPTNSQPNITSSTDSQGVAMADQTLTGCCLAIVATAMYPRLKGTTTMKAVDITQMSVLLSGEVVVS